MFHRIKRVAAASCLTSAMAMAVTAMPISVGPAAAMTPVNLPLQATVAGEGNVEQAQYRGRGRQRANRAYRQGRRDGRWQARNRQQLRRRWHNNRWYYWDNDGWWYNSGGAAVAAAAGIAGLFAGAALAAPRGRTIIIEQGGVPAPYTGEWYRQCDLKYNSFRSSDGTYLGYDGFRHTCRLP